MCNFLSRAKSIIIINFLQDKYTILLMFGFSNHVHRKSRIEHSLPELYHQVNSISESILYYFILIGLLHFTTLNMVYFFFISINLEEQLQLL